MAKEQFNVYLPTEVIAMVRQLAVTDRGVLTNSEIVESAIRKMHTAAQPLKRVERVYDGRKMVGYNGFYGDHQVAYEEKTEAKAQAKVDQYAYEAAKERLA